MPFIQIKSVVLRNYHTSSESFTFIIFVKYIVVLPNHWRFVPPTDYKGGTQTEVTQDARNDAFKSGRCEGDIRRRDVGELV